MQGDFIRELVTRLLAEAKREGTLTETAAQEVERQFRHDYRGAKYVVCVRPRQAVIEKKESMVKDYLANDPVEVITKRHGVSRATLYRYLKE